MYYSNKEVRRTQKRYRYLLNVDKVRAKRRDHYRSNVEKQRSRKREFYCLNVEKHRAKNRNNYLLKRKNICDQKRKRYNQQMRNQIGRHKMNAVKKIITKYRRIDIASTLSLLQSKERYIANIVPMINAESKAEQNIKAESIIK